MGSTTQGAWSNLPSKAKSQGQTWEAHVKSALHKSVPIQMEMTPPSPSAPGQDLENTEKGQISNSKPIYLSILLNNNNNNNNNTSTIFIYALFT